MNSKLDNYLVEKYPKIFINRYKDEKESLMCFGFDHGDGWFWLLDQLCGSIQDYIDTYNKYRKPEDHMKQLIADQVKEKFGSLNFYSSYGDVRTSGMISLAASMSTNICENCGSTENMGTTNMWISHICKDCHENIENYSRRNWKADEEFTPEISKELRLIKIQKLNKFE